MNVDKHIIREQRRFLQTENKKYPKTPVQVSKNRWPDDEEYYRIAVWRSSTHLIQVFQENAGIIRLSICRTNIDRNGQWTDGITWDELQSLKDQIGYGAREAVEIYPPTHDTVNVANIRHLWVLPERLPFSWKR